MLTAYPLASGLVISEDTGLKLEQATIDMLGMM